MTQPIVRTNLPVAVSTTFSSEDYRFENLEEHLQKISRHQTWPCPLSLLFGESSFLTTQESLSKSPDNCRDQEHIQRTGREIKSLLLDISSIKDKKRFFKNLFEFFPFIDKESMEKTFLKSSKKEPSYFQKLLNSTNDYSEEHKFFALALALWYLREANKSFAQHLASKDTLNFNEQNRINYNGDLKKALYFCSNALKIDLKLGQKCPECLYMTNELIFHLTSNSLRLRLKNSQLDESYFQEVFGQIEQKKNLCFSPTHSNFIAQLYTTVTDTIPDFEHDSREKYRCKIDPAQRRRKECQFCPPSSPPIPHKYLSALQEYRLLFERFTSEPGDVALIRSTQADLTGKLIDLADKVLEDAFLIVGPPPCPYDIRVLGSVGRGEACPFSDIEFMILYSYRKDVYSTEHQEELRKKWHEEYFRTLAEVFNFLMILIGESGTSELIFPNISTLEGFRVDSGVNPGHDIRLMGTPVELAQRQEKEEEAAEPRTLGQLIRHSQSLKKSPRDSSLFHDYVKAMGEILDEPQERRRERYAFQLFNHRWNDYNKAWEDIDFQKLDLKKQFINLFHLLSDIAFYKRIRQTNTLDIIKELSNGETPVFTPQSGALLQEFFASLYHIRSRIQLSHQKQLEEEEAFAPHPQLPLQERGRLQEREKKQLEKCYWLVLRPLYRALEKVIKGGKRFEEVFNSLDLLHVTAEEIFQLQEGEGKARSALLHLVAYVALHPHYYEMLKRYYQTIPDNLENFSLKFSILEALESILNQNSLTSEQSRALKAFIEELAAIPDSTGFRMGMMMEERAFHARLKEATASSVQSSGIIKEVRVESSIRNPELRSCFLRSEVIEEILDETGHIRNSYPGSAHLVTGSKCGLHFKEMPVQPLMEYAVYNLFFRLAGHLSPIGELVHFRVKILTLEGKEENINYPVLISKSLSTDKTLKTHIPSAIQDPRAWKRWTWMTLCSPLTKPGDGLPSNYIFEDENIFCVDNDISFVIPYIYDSYFFKKINFCAAIFFLYANRALDPEVLNLFCCLDIDTILSTWIEEVKAKEKAYLALFPKKEDREKWAENPDCKKRFSATAVFCEGAIITLKFQFHQLQNYILLHQKRERGITALDLLEQMVVYCDFYKENKVGLDIANAYRRALTKTNLGLEQKIQEELKRQRGGSLSLPEAYKVCLNRAPSFKEVETLQLWTPSEASRELSAVILKESSPYVSIVISAKQRVIQANFRGFANGGSQQTLSALSEMRQRQILRALLSQEETYVKNLTTVILQYCEVLDFRSLEPFLQPTLEHLDIRFSPRITDGDLVRIQQRCPRLRKLYLSGCSQIINLCSHRLIGPVTIKEDRPLSFSALEILEIFDAENLEVIKLDAPALVSIIGERNPSLRIVEVNPKKIPEWRFDKCPNFLKNTELANIAKRVLDLDDSQDGFFNARLQSSTLSSLSYRAQSEEKFRKNLLSLFFQLVALKINTPALENCANIFMLIIHIIDRSNKVDLLDAFYEMGDFISKGQGFSMDTTEAIKWYLRAATGGLAKAQFVLGRYYESGQGVTKDESKAFEWYQKVAEQGLAVAQHNLGVCYANGRGIAKDESKAFEWYQKAAEQGLAIAQHNLGLCYESGHGVAKDESKAFEWYQKAALQGHAGAKLKLGHCYDYGVGVPRDKNEAFNWYKKAAEQGEIGAQLEVGICYANAQEVERDLREAFKWYEKAAKQGDARAQFELGVCYAKGWGIAIDKKEALNCYKQAAKQGHIGAYYELEISDEFDPDIRGDIEIFQRAAELGFPKAQFQLGTGYEHGLGISEDKSKAFEWYRKAAEKGLAKAQFKLGRCYEFGQGVARDESKAFEWYMKAVDQGYGEASYTLGQCYRYGWGGVRIDKKKAISWYREAARQGFRDAKRILGDCYANGEDVPKSEKEAVYWYREAAEQGCGYSQDALGMCYAKGLGVIADANKAFEQFKKAAEQGCDSAQFNLGLCYQDGRGVVKNDSEAFLQFQKAARQGHDKARYALGVCYANGRGVSKDEKEAVYWYQKAAFTQLYSPIDSEELKEAQYALGVCYANGQGVLKDEKEAAYCYQKAAEQGFAPAQNRLGMCSYYGRGIPKDKKKASEWFQKAADQGDASAQFNLGACYEEGRGVAKDESKAFEWYQKAALQGLAAAENNLGYCYANGQGVSKDENKAFEWYQKAAEKGFADAQYNLGFCYKNGRGVAKDESKAIEWYKKASAQEYLDAQLRLKQDRSERAVNDRKGGVLNKKELEKTIPDDSDKLSRPIFSPMKFVPKE